MMEAGACWMLPGLQYQDHRCHCLLSVSFTDGYDLWMIGVRSCYDEGNRTTETLTMDSLTKHFSPSDIFMYWFASISINWTTKTERLLRQSPLGAEIKSRLYIISRCILMLIRWHDWRRTDLDDILIPCLNLILCKNILVLSIGYIFS